MSILTNMVFALSDTLDLVGIDEVHHGKRVGCMLWECATVSGLDRDWRKNLFQMGLLHDCGVSSTQVHEKLVREMDWEGSYEHCEIGAKRLTKFKPLSDMADVIYYHHTHWEDLKRLSLPEEIAQSANMIFLMDRVDALLAGHLGVDLLQAKDEIRNQILQYRGTYFDPRLIDLFMTASARESFWISLEPRPLLLFIHEREKERESLCLSMKDLKKMAVVFARIVDAKSHYTAKHSVGVALLAKYLSHLCGLSAEQCSKIEIAGLLHDLGKLRVPDDILEKPGKLNIDDLAHMRHHSYETFMILKRIEGMEDIALWAANHHEALNGKGYPFHRVEKELSIESRIITVADIFQALAQERPYRKPLNPKQILDILKHDTLQGRLDQGLVDLVEQHLPDCYQAATGVL